jgi:hypothetical protein
MIQSTGNNVLPRGKWKKPSVFFDLVHNELIQRELPRTDKGIPTGGRIDRQNTL